MEKGKARFFGHGRGVGPNRVRVRVRDRNSAKLTYPLAKATLMENDNRVEARLFAGILISSEIRMHLNQNPAWKNAQISAFHGSDDLFEVRHGKNKYIGCYVDGHKVPLSEVHKYSELTLNKLLAYCPRLAATACKFYIFPQLFIH